MESAIPEHLRNTRTRHRRVPDDYVPPYPSFVARHKPSVACVVMAYFGVQTRGAPSKTAEQAMAWIASRFESNAAQRIGTGHGMSTKPVSRTS
jgi:aldoxime dehydratase